MDKDNKINAVEQLIRNSKNIAIIPSPNGGVDSFSAALGLFLGIKDQNREVSLVYSGVVSQVFDDLLTEDDVIKDTSKRDLSVSIDYSKSSAQKVAYSTTDNVLTLKIGPVDKNFDLENVKSKLEGFGFDLIILVGVKEKTDLGNSYTDLEEDFKASTVVNLDNSEANLKYGDFNIIEPSHGSLSLLMLNFMAKAGLVVNSEAAKALLKGITYKQSN